MPTSGLYNYSTTRNGIITRALRLIGAIGQGETPSSDAISEGAEALNDIVKAWEADGMPLWCITQYSVRLVSGVNMYVIEPGPLKLLQAWMHDTSNNTDSPTNIITRQEYQLLGTKLGSGTPSQIWYDPPGTSLPNVGIIKLFPTPDSNAAEDKILQFSGHKPFQYFNASTDIPDFPDYWYDALKWGLANELAYEYGVGLAERSMITKQAEKKKEDALSFGTEEGSFKIEPRSKWGLDT